MNGRFIGCLWLSIMCGAVGISRGAESTLDANDISILWPVPKTSTDVQQLVGADTALSKGGSLWPKTAFDAVLQTVDTINFPRQPGLDPFSIKLPPQFRNQSVWKIAALRFDASAPGSHSDLITRFGSTPQIRIILQPVTDKPIKVHDFTAHLVFDFSAPPATSAPQRAIPDRKAFNEILNDLRDIKNFCENSGASTKGLLSVHPGLAKKAKETRDKLVSLLKKHLSENRLRAVSFMGIDRPEPWIFFAMTRSNSNGTLRLFAPPSIQPATAQMLSFRGIDRVVPQPNLLEHKVSTAMLFAPNVTSRLDQPVSAELGSVRLRDIPAIIANPQTAHFFNTDCVSCHSESTRRNTLKISDDSPFSFKRPTSVDGVDETLIPKDLWNVRNFGWGVERTGKVVATISTRTANETAESVAFINKEFGTTSSSGESDATSPKEDDDTSGAHALTLIMTAKSKEDYAAVKETITALQKDPNNPIKKALDQIGIVHDARFVLFDEQQRLGVITTFDDDFDVYLDLFISEIGNVFDAVLKHMKDAPPLPVAEHPEEFHAYVHKNNRELVSPFYSAYPKLRVSDILRMQRESESGTKQNVLATGAVDARK
jgi:hypothetical protein